MNDRRVRNRMPISLPVEVLGHNYSNNRFHEVGKTANATSFDLCIKLTTLVREGSLLHLSLKMPHALRRFDLDQEEYQFFARVERVNCLPQNEFEIGATIIGKQLQARYQWNMTANNYQELADSSPAQPQEQPQAQSAHIPYSKTPANGIFAVTPEQISAHTSRSISRAAYGEEKRRAPRIATTIAAEFEFLDANEQVVTKEDGFINNISRTGACIVSSYYSEPGDKIRIKFKLDNFISNSVVRNVDRLQAGQMKLHVEFINNTWQENQLAQAARKFTQQLNTTYNVCKFPAQPQSSDIAQELYRDGIELYEAGRFSEAAIALRQATTRAPEKDEYWHQLALTYCEIPGQERQAEMAFRQAMKCNRRNANYAIDLGLLYERKGEMMKARLMYKRALQITPEDRNARLALATMAESNREDRLKKLSRFIHNLSSVKSGH